MSALFANRRVTHLRDIDTIWSKYVSDKDLRKCWNYFNGHRTCSGEIAKIGSACDIEMLQGVLCECLLTKVIKKILNKINKIVLFNESLH